MESIQSAADFLRVCEALAGRDHDAITEASNVLLQFRKTGEAWEVSNTVLMEGEEELACFQAANIMRWKVAYHFLELGEDTTLSLRDSLLMLLKRFSGQSYSIVRQLSIALADAAVYMEQWEDPIGDVIGDMQDEFADGLLEYLIVLPQEADNARLKVKRDRRRDLTNSLGELSGPVFAFLSSVVEAHREDDAKLELVLKALASWLTLSGDGLASFDQSDLIPVILNCVKNAALSYSATAAMDSLLCFSMTSAYSHLVSPIADAVLDFGEVFVAEDTDYEVRKNIAWVTAVCGRTYIYDIVQGIDPDTKEKSHFKQAEKLVEAISFYTGNDDADIALQTIDFWLELTDVSFDLNLHHLFVSLYESLLEQLFYMCQCDGGMESVLTENDDVFDIRTDVRTLAKEVAEVLGTGTMITHLCQGLGSEEWQSREAVMFLIYSVIRKVSKKSNSIIPLVEFILGLTPADHPQLLKTTIKIIGDLSQWFTAHTDLVPAAIDYLASIIHVPGLAHASIIAMDFLVAKNARNLQEKAGIMYQLLQSPPEEFTEDNFLDLVKICARMMGTFTGDLIKEGMNTMLSPFKETAIEALDSAEQTAPSSLAVNLTRMSEGFRHCNIIASNVCSNGEHPCLQAAVESWEVITTTFERYGSDSKAVEAANKCIKWVVRCLGPSADGLVEVLLPLLFEVFDSTKHPSCLYVASIIVKTMKDNEERRTDILTLVESMTNTAMEFLATKMDRLTAETNLIEDLFRVHCRALQHFKLYVLRDTEFTQTMLSMVPVLCLLDAPCTEVIYSYLDQLFSLHLKGDDYENETFYHEYVCGLFEAEGQALIELFMAALSGGLPPRFSYDIANVIWSMRAISPAAVPSYAENAPCLQEIPPNKAQPEHILDMLQAVGGSKTLKKLRSALKHYARLFDESEGADEDDDAARAGDDVDYS